MSLGRLQNSSSSGPWSSCSHFLEARSQNHGSLRHVSSLVIMSLTSSPWCCSVYRAWLRILSVALEKALKTLTSCWLHCYYLVCFDPVPLFLHVLTSLIKLILWLKSLHGQNAGRGHGEKDHRCGASATSSIIADTVFSQWSEMSPAPWTVFTYDFGSLLGLVVQLVGLLICQDHGFNYWGFLVRFNIE